MADIFNMADTWNDGATTFTAIKMNVTNTASASGSLLMDLQVGGTTKFSVSKDGAVVLGVDGSGNAYITLGTKTYNFAGSIIKTSMSWSDNVQVDSNGIKISNDATTGIAWSSTANIFGAADITTIRDDAGVLAQRSGTTAQTFNIYNTYTDASNYERGFLKWNTNVLEIGTAAAGTGTARVLALQTAGTDRLQFDTTGSMELSTALTVATLPGTPVAGMIARVTDANAPAVGSTVAGSGAAAALVWYNGSNWTVIGV